MKFLNKLTLIIFSWIILIEAIIICVLVFGWMDLGRVGLFAKDLLVRGTSSNIILGVSIVCILLALKTIFFSSFSDKEDRAQGVLLENENGKLMISKETLENLVNSVAKGFGGTEEVNTRIELDNDNNVKVYANLIVSTDAVIKNLSSNLQKKVKEKVKNATDLEVKEVNIKIKNVAPKKEVDSI